MDWDSGCFEIGMIQVAVWEGIEAVLVIEQLMKQ